MSIEDKKAHVRRLPKEAWNQGNTAIRDGLIAPDYDGHEHSMTIQRYEGYRQFVSQYRSAFPDLHFKIEDMIVVGDKVVVL